MADQVVASTTVDGVKYAVQFETVPFAEGVSRYAYKGVMVRPSERKGEKVVVKKFRERYVKYKKDWDTDVQVAKTAEQLAQKFNRVSKTTRPINYKLLNPMKVKNSEEWVAVEYFLHGEYTKWLSNAGWVNQQEMGEGGSLPAFSHWTWVETNGQLLVCDLQGVKDNPTGYWLTDPAIHSTSRSYGDTDLGNIGMHMFFTTHKCTEFCHALNLENKRPNRAVLKSNASLTKCRNTVYSGQVEEKGLWALALPVIQEKNSGENNRSHVGGGLVGVVVGVVVGGVVTGGLGGMVLGALLGGGIAMRMMTSEQTNKR